MSKHAPGPWTVAFGQPANHSDDGGGGFTIVIGGRPVPWVGGYIGYAEDVFADDAGYSEAEANARLIAAAPELLSALKEAAAAVALVADQYTGQSQRDLLAVRDIARAAIAKATGA